MLTLTPWTLACPERQSLNLFTNNEALITYINDSFGKDFRRFIADKQKQLLTFYRTIAASQDKFAGEVSFNIPRLLRRSVPGSPCSVGVCV